MPENVQIPPQGISKVIQLYINDQPVLRAGNNNDFHGNILAAALDEFGVPYKKIDLTGGRKGPEKEGEHYKLVGAGHCTHTFTKLNFSSNSQDCRVGIDRMHYRVGIDRKHIDKCMPEFEKEGLKVMFSYF